MTPAQSASTGGCCLPFLASPPVGPSGVGTSAQLGGIYAFLWVGIPPAGLIPYSRLLDRTGSVRRSVVGIPPLPAQARRRRS